MYRLGPASKDAVLEILNSQGYLLVEMVRRFTTTWMEMLGPVVQSCCEVCCRERFFAHIPIKRIPQMSNFEAIFPTVVIHVGCRVHSYCVVQDISCGKLSASLLDATRERFQTLLRGHVASFLLGLTNHFGLEAIARLPPYTGGADGAATMPPGAQVLLLAVRTQALPSRDDLAALVRQPILRYFDDVPRAPLTPGFNLLRKAIQRKVGTVASSFPMKMLTFHSSCLCFAVFSILWYSCRWRCDIRLFRGVLIISAVVE